MVPMPSEFDILQPIAGYVAAEPTLGLDVDCVRWRMVLDRLTKEMWMGCGR